MADIYENIHIERGVAALQRSIPLSTLAGALTRDPVISELCACAAAASREAEQELYAADEAAALEPAGSARKRSDMKAAG